MRVALTWAVVAMAGWAASDVVADAEVDSASLDYPGADAGLIIDPPRVAHGAIEGYDLPPAAQRVAETADQWGEPDAGPYFEWALAGRKGRYYALPDPAIVQLEKLDTLLEKSGVSLSDQEANEQASEQASEQVGEQVGQKAEVSTESPLAAPRRLDDGVSNVLNAVNSAANSVADSAVADGNAASLVLDQGTISNLANAISNSMANVADAAGLAVGVTSTHPPPVNQAVLGLLSILQGLQKLALAVGSINSAAM